mgnify:CR=1 FL=1
MAKKKKTANVDINQALIDNLDISEQMVEEQPNEEDEFESLLNSFLKFKKTLFMCHQFFI